MFQRVQIDFAVLRPHSYRRVSAPQQKQVHQQSCRSPIAVGKRMNGDQPEMCVEAVCRFGTGTAQQLSVLLHQQWNLRGIWKYNWRTRDATGQRTVNASDLGLAAEDNTPVEFAHGRLIDGCGRRRYFPHPQHSVVMVYCLQMIAERFAAHGDTVLDQLRRFAPGQRVAFDSVGCIGQMNVIGFLQGNQRIPGKRAQRVQPGFSRGDGIQQAGGACSQFFTHRCLLSTCSRPSRAVTRRNAVITSQQKMNRRAFLTAMAASTLPAVTSKPNIVYILADDLGWGDLGCYNPESKVPMANANKLASQGMRFTDMHSGSAVCTPTRYGILTGRYCWRTHLKDGVLWGYSPNLIESGRMTVASLLKSNGYHTGGVGKWHLGLGTAEKTDYSKPLKPGPVDHGFDYYFGIPASLDMDPYLYFENDHAVEQPTKTSPGRNEPRGVFWRPGPIAPHFQIEEVLPTLQNKAVAYIRDRAKTPDKPFFLYFPLTGPHTPWVPLSRYKDKSGAGIYGDFAVQVDDTLGAIMKVLDETGLSSNTLLVFTSDNGAHWTPADKEKYPHRANASWRGMKADIHEAGHRIPFLARWPGKIKPGSVNNDVACLGDLMATAAEITGTKLPPGAGEDSFSLLPALTGGKATRDAIVHHSVDGMFSIRQGEWKLALGKGSGGFSEPKRIAGSGGQLYNLASDPGETKNLYDSKPDIVKRLTALLEKYQREGHSRPL